MENGNQGQSSHALGQQNRAQNANRSTGSVSWNNIMNTGRQGSVGNIWSSNPLTDNLPPRDNSGASAGTQRTTAIGTSDSNPWARPGASTWNSADSQPFRPSASRSTSPPSTSQNGSNTSPNFNSNRAATSQNSAFSTANFKTTFAPMSNSLANLSSYVDNNAPGDSGAGFQQGFMGFQRPSQGLSTAFEDSHPPSRHSETESPLQFPSENPVFGGGLGSHSRHASRISLSGASTGFSHPRSQSQSYITTSDQTQAALDSVRATLLRDRLQTSSPGPRGSITQGSTPAPSQLSYPPINGFSLGNGNMQETRRDSLANSIHGQSLMNSPGTFAAPKLSDPWNPIPTLDFETVSRIQRSQQNQMSRQASQASYIDGYIQYSDVHAQLMQQMHPGFSPYANYGYQPGQPFFPPTAPAGMIPRGSRSQDMTVGIRCPELEEFRRSAKSNKKWELKHIFGRIVEFAGDQQGSRFLQEKIPSANSDDRQRVFDEIMVDANALMVDVFGNYVVQQLFEHGTMVQKKVLAGKMKGHVVQLSMQLYGCRCVQEALEYILVEQQVELALELEPEILRVMKNENGNHVVQKVLTKLPRERIDFVYEAVRGKVFELSQQQYACRVIQRMIEKGSEADKTFILQEFHEVAHRLVTDNWGNYVVQAVIRQGGQEARSRVIRLCIEQFQMFSKQKVASNVMEHCIEYGSPEDRLEMYRLITRRAEDGSSLLQTMWKDNFANYVVQKLCHHLEGAEQEHLVRESKPFFEQRKKPSRPDDKWLKFEQLINRFKSAPASRHGSVSSLDGGAHGNSGSRPQSQAGSTTMPTPGLTTGGNSPRTSSSQDTNDAGLEHDQRYIEDHLSKTTLRNVSENQVA